MLNEYKNGLDCLLISRKVKKYRSLEKKNLPYFHNFVSILVFNAPSPMKQYCWFNPNAFLF